MAKKSTTKPLAPGVETISGAQGSLSESVPIKSKPSKRSKVAVVEDDRPLAIKINNASLVELKNTCDDAVKLYFSKPNAFTQNHANEDMRLSVGWAAVSIGFAAAYYGYTTPFHEGKYIVGAGVSIYAILSAFLAYHLLFVEKVIIYQGKRRTFSGRISTETLEISTTASTGHTPYLSPSAILLSLVVPTKSQPPPTVPYPVYTVSATYVHSSNGGKSLIKQEEVRIERCFGDFFDEQGTFWATGFEKFLGELEGKLMQS